MRYIVTLGLIMIAYSCNNLRTTNYDNPFKTYYSQINEISLPVQFDCHNDSAYTKYSNDNINDTLKIKFKPEGCNIFGRLSIYDSIVSIIYMMSADFYYPTIFTYKLDGTPIDTFCLYSGESCDGFPGQGSRSIGSISKNNLIVLSDTLRTYQLDSLDNIIEDSDTLTISTYRYKMLNNGHFEKIDENKVKK
jgi:hypothetical protein